MKLTEPNAFMNFSGQPEKYLGHRWRGSTQVDLSHRMNKNDFCHNFKTQLENWPEAMFRSWVERVNLANPKCFKIIFFKKNQWVFDMYYFLSWLEFLTGSDRVNPSLYFFKLGLV